MDDQQEKQSGWWGATLSKLKGALSKTKSVLVDAVVDRDEEDPGAAGEPIAETEAEPVAQVQQALTEMVAEQIPSIASPPLPPPPPHEEQSAAAEPTPEPQPPVTRPEPMEPIETAPLTPLEQAAPFNPVPISTPLPAPDPVAASPAPLPPADTTPPPPTPKPEPRPEPAPAPKPAPSAPSQPPRPAHPGRAIDDDYLEDLEEKLIKADIGLKNVETIVSDLRREAKQKNWNSHNVEAFLRREFEGMLATAPSSELKLHQDRLNIVLVVGVNGTGKTTSIGKLCWRLKQQGRRVLLAAGDTFRAAAETQLEIWAERAGVDIVRLPEGADPGAVVYQAIQKATAEDYEILIIDTAGRLHNKANLMAELKKVRSVVDKQAGNAHIESLLVIDASTGQNGLQQAKVFAEFCPLTGVVLTKLDGSAKGGIVFSIARDLKLPVKLIGLGEKIDDLRLFDPRMFVEALF